MTLKLHRIISKSIAGQVNSKIKPGVRVYIHMFLVDIFVRHAIPQRVKKQCPIAIYLSLSVPLEMNYKIHWQLINNVRK